MTAVQTFTAPIEEGDLPTEKGAYALLIRLPRRLRTSVGSLGRVDFPAGDYFYLGSAYGPGGLRARLRRHLRVSKKVHWHVDHLTKAGDIVDIIAVPAGRECDLVDRVLPCAGVSVPINGFGSSDCPRCPAHLLYVSDDAQPVLTALAS